MRRMVVTLLFLSGCSVAACASPKAPPRASVDEKALAHSVERELDDLHAAASEGDEARYLGHFERSAVFLGTDQTERWPLAKFAEFVHAHFVPAAVVGGERVTAKGWAYSVVRRDVRLSSDGQTAWFDEDLLGEKAGPTRGSGVLLRVNDRYLIAQYNLAFTIPNARFEAMRRAITEEPPPSLQERKAHLYKDATAAANRGELSQAIETLSSLVPEAKKHPEDPLEYWLHNELTWVFWATGDLVRALEEVNAGGVAIDHATIPDAKKDALRLHERWDRAYLLLELALQKPGDRRLLAAANEARSAYDALALRRGEKDDGKSVLEAFFAVRLSKPKAAAAAAKRVDIEKDEDLQDLYVIALALDANGERAAALAVTKRICDGNDYLMKPLLRKRMHGTWMECPSPH